MAFQYSFHANILYLTAALLFISPEHPPIGLQAMSTDSSAPGLEIEKREKLDIWIPYTASFPSIKDEGLDKAVL